IAAEAAVGPDHAMARHDDRDRVRAVRRADRADGARLADHACDLAVRDRPPERDATERRPHLPLECGPSRVERDVGERRAVAGEVGAETADDAGGVGHATQVEGAEALLERARAARPAPRELDRADAAVAGRDHEWTNRRGELGGFDDRHGFTSWTRK